MPRLSIIIPVLDEAATIAETLAALAAYRARGAEIIVVDGGSRDGSLAAARPFADHVITAPRRATCCCFFMPTRACRPRPTGSCAMRSRGTNTRGGVST